MRSADRPIQRVDVLGVPVDAVDMEAALRAADRAAQGSRPPFRILAVNPEKVWALRRGALPREPFGTSELLIPDGIGVVWAVRLLYGIRISRVAGADLMQELCSLAATRGYSVFLFGATEEVNREAARILEQRYPGLRIAGRRNGYFEGDGSDIVNEINACGANILFVALGSPKQERWIFRNAPRLSVSVIQGVGGTLDTISGRVRRAPVIFQRMHLEWLYRLIIDPRRIRRQIVLPAFAWKVLIEWLRR